MMKKGWSIRSVLYSIAAVVSFLGVLNAGYLAYTALTGGAPTCNFLHGCEIVARSEYSKVFGIPLSLFGVFFYTVTLGVSVWALIERDKTVLYLFTLFAIPGFLLSLYFLYLQAYKIFAFCEYCLFSLFDATVLFIIAIVLWVRMKKDMVGESESAETV